MPHHARKNRAGRNEHAKRSLRTALSDTESKISKQFRHASTEVEEKHPHNAEADWFKEINCFTRLRRKKLWQVWQCNWAPADISTWYQYISHLRLGEYFLNSCGWRKKKSRTRVRLLSERSFSFDPFNRSLYLNFKDTNFKTHLRPARYVQPPWGQDVKARALMNEMI